MKKQVRKVLVVENGSGFGGALTSLKSLLDGISPEAGWEFHLLTSYPQDYIRAGEKGIVSTAHMLPRNKRYGPASRFEKALRRRGFSRPGPFCFIVDFFTSALPYALRVKRLIQTLDIDLVHLNNTPLINDAAIMASFLSRVPCIAHVRAPEYNGRVSRFLSGLPAHFMPVSQFVANGLHDLGVPNNKITVVHEGIDVERFKQDALRADFNSVSSEDRANLKICMVGCLVPWKGHEIFIKAVSEVQKRRKVKAFIIGASPDGNMEFENNLRRITADYGLGNSVVFLGHRNDVASLINECDILVHASTEPEPFGRVIIEGMAIGKPVIATDIGGPREIIKHCHSGLLVPPGNIEEMAAAIQSLADVPALRDEIAENGKSLAVNQYSIERHVRHVLTVYNSVFNG